MCAGYNVSAATPLLLLEEAILKKSHLINENNLNRKKHIQRGFVRKDESMGDTHELYVGIFYITRSN